jgi:hypothetical protein
LTITGVDATEVRDHDSPFDLAKGRVPLEDGTIGSPKRLYTARRTTHSYRTRVTTADQAEHMRTVATLLHEHIVPVDPERERFCLCSA